jgi:5'-nucleotidase
MKKNTKPLILVTNDDGITAPGIRALIEVMNKLGEVVVVAPDSAQSGMGHAVTVHDILLLEEVEIDKGPQKEYKSSGTPVDCVKLGISEVLHRKPDLIVSGINHGSNASINVIYSGTMSAAVEGGIEGVPSIGFSLMDFSWDADFSAAQFYVEKIATEVLKNGMPEGIVLNVNIPKLPLQEIKGIKVARQAKAKWEETFDKRTNPFGKDYYWLAGEFKNLENKPGTDLHALENGYVSVVPIQYDLTAYQWIDALKRIEDENN